MILPKNLVAFSPNCFHLLCSDGMLINYEFAEERNGTHAY